MPAEAIWLLLFVVAVLVAPFATLRAVSHFRSRRRARREAPPPRPAARRGYDDDEDDDAR